MQIEENIQVELISAQKNGWKEIPPTLKEKNGASKSAQLLFSNFFFVLKIYIKIMLFNKDLIMHLKHL